MGNPNLHKDEMDRVYKVEGGGGGGIRLFNFEFINEVDGNDYYIVHGATVNDLKSIVYLHGFFDNEEDSRTVPYAYVDSGFGNNPSLICLFDYIVGQEFFIDGEYLDGVKVHSEGFVAE